MPKVKDLIFKYDNKLKDGVDIEKEKSKKKFKEILEKFKSGSVNTPTNINYEKPAIIHDDKFNNKLSFWKEKEKEKEVQEIQENPEEEHIEKVVKKKKNKEKKDKKNKKIEEIIEPIKIEEKKADLKKENKSKKVKKDKPLKNKDSEEDLEDEFEKMLKDL